MSNLIFRTSKRNIIYLLPIGVFPDDAPSMDQFSTFVSNYFSLSCKILPSISIEAGGKNTVDLRSDPYLYPIKIVISTDLPGSLKFFTFCKKLGTRRLHALEIMRVLKDFLPKDGYCIFGVTPEDIYEHYSKKDKNDQAILGRASGDRVGTF
jgi:hypothetical protein